MAVVPVATARAEAIGLRAAVRGQVVVAAALLSAGAAAIHAAVAGPHLDEYVPFGVLFIATALGQAAWSALALTAPSLRLFAVGAVGNVGVVAAWAMSRTTGMPVGPASWQPEAITALDVAATAFECAVVLACLVLVAGGRPYAALSARAVKPFAAVGAAAVVALTCAAFAAAPRPAEHHHGATVEEATPPRAGDRRPSAAGQAQEPVKTPAERPAKAATRPEASPHHAHGGVRHSHPAP